MKIKRSTLEELPISEWDQFIERSLNGTLFSKPTFYQHHDTFRNPAFISIYENDKIVAALVGIIDQKKCFISPAFASFGGILVSNNLRFSVTEQLLKELTIYFQSIEINELIMTFPPDCYWSKQDQSLNYLLKYYGAKEVKTLYTSVVALDDFSIQSCSTNGRRGIRKAVKLGIHVEKVQDFNELRRFYEILITNKKKFNLEPTHTLDEIKRLIELFPESIDVLGAYLGNELIGGVLNMNCNQRVKLTFYIAGDENYSEYYPINALLYHSCIQAQSDGLNYVDFGVSMETDTDNPMDPRHSLIHFKEHFSSFGQERRTFILDLLKVK